jgi:hypothetical protein
MDYACVRYADDGHQDPAGSAVGWDPLCMLIVMLSSIETGSRLTLPAREGKAREALWCVLLLG